MKRRVHYDDRGLPQSTTVEYSQEDMTRQVYGFVRLVFLLPLIGLGFYAWAGTSGLGWHPVFALASGFGVPIAGAAILHFVPWLRSIYDAAVTLASAFVAFIVVRGSEGGDLIWAGGAAAVVILIGGLMTLADMRSDD